MNENVYDKQLRLLCDALLSAKTRGEMEALLYDLCTPSELRSLAQRIHVAQLLDEKALYSDIEKETLASTATISRVRKFFLGESGKGGYRAALGRLARKK